MGSDQASPAPLHLVQLLLNGRELLRSARNQGLPDNVDDLGYLMHGHLSALFGDEAPQPFRVERKRGDVEVLGYGSADKALLQERADLFALPADLKALRGLASKPMPSAWRTGQRLGFEVRVCPVVRRRSSGDGHRAGAEVDAFLAACSRAGSEQPVDRYQTYLKWLQEQLAPAARLVSQEVLQFRRARLFRRTQGAERKGRQLERPDVLIQGELEVSESDAFSQLLARGVGRHRAFGFGMLLLRPPSRG